MNHWKKNQLVMIQTDSSLGPARIVDDQEAQFFSVEFLRSKEQRNYTKKNSPFKRVQFHVGQSVVHSEHGELSIETISDRNDLFYFQAGEIDFDESQISSINVDFQISDLVRQMQISKPNSFDLRKRVSGILEYRNLHPMKGIAGCRVELLPHQLWVAKKACENSPVRALLADEVGLGKTIEAGLIFSSLHASGELNRVLILVPEPLKIQWLTEFYRRFNVRFRLDHEEVLDEEDHRDFVITSPENLEHNIAEFDLIIVDEAHRLCRNNEKSILLEQLITKSKHAIFLSATPQLYGQDEYLKMLRTLQGDQPVKIFQCKRSELHFECHRQLEARYVEDKLQWVEDFLKSKIDEGKSEKVFLITSGQEQVVKLHERLRARLGEHFSVFHEGMDLVERDRQAAYFAAPEGAPFLLSSEIGGEGRNFQFCKNLVMLDLPNDPLVIEQRIGRLDRIGQKSTVSVWVPITEDDEEETSFEKLRDEYEVFSKPWTGAGRADFQNDLPGDLSRNSTSLTEGGEQFYPMDFNEDEANQYLAQARELDDAVVLDELEEIYDLFGVELEDFDSEGNQKAQITAQSFVDYFPGLGAEGEKVLSFDRTQALSFENYAFFSSDHPDFIESCEYFLNSIHGRVALTQLCDDHPKDLFLLLQVKELDSPGLTYQLWQYSTQTSKVPQDSIFYDGRLIDPSVPPLPWKSLPQEFFEQIGECLDLKVKLPSGSSIDSVLVICPS